MVETCPRRTEDGCSDLVRPARSQKHDRSSQTARGDRECRGTLTGETPVRPRRRKGSRACFCFLLLRTCVRARSVHGISSHGLSQLCARRRARVRTFTRHTVSDRSACNRLVSEKKKKTFISVVSRPIRTMERVLRSRGPHEGARPIVVTPRMRLNHSQKLIRVFTELPGGGSLSRDRAVSVDTSARDRTCMRAPYTSGARDQF